MEIIQIDRADYVGTLNTRAAGNNLPDTGIMAEDAVLMWAEQGMLADASNMYGPDEAKPWTAWPSPTRASPWAIP